MSYPQTTEDFVDDIIIKLWNDIVNRNAGKQIYTETLDVFEARKAMLDLIEAAHRVSLTPPTTDRKEK